MNELLKLAIGSQSIVFNEVLSYFYKGNCEQVCAGNLANLLLGYVVVIMVIQSTSDIRDSDIRDFRL